MTEQKGCMASIADHRSFEETVEELRRHGMTVEQVNPQTRTVTGTCDPADEDRLREVPGVEAFALTRRMKAL